jgi:nucleoside-diphosphate-sugar epimerase
MRIAIIGSNGQVAAEVVLLLSTQPDVDLVPVVRSRSGSVFLRYKGVPVFHGSITDQNQALSALKGADVIANFALAGGTPFAALKQNEEIIRATFEHSPASATIVFYSTLSVHGQDYENGRSKVTSYGKLKLRNEMLMTRLAKKLGRKAYVLRLGHVAGTYQNITQLWRKEFHVPPVIMPDPERHSNVTHTVTIADALLAISSGRAGPPGLYDLVNMPQWTWRDIYEKEAKDLGVELELETADVNLASRLHIGTRIKEILFGTINQLGLRERLMRMSTNMPGAVNDVMKAEYYVNRARNEIAALQQTTVIRNSAGFWPALDIHALEGLKPTRELFDSNAFPMEHRHITRWPADLVT